MRSLARALVLSVGAVLALTACGVDDRPRISIEFGADPDLLEGVDVRIDGRVVGKLTSTGQATRCSFPVAPGVHELCLDVEGFGCEPFRFEVQFRGQKVRTLVALGDRTDALGRPLVSFIPM